MSLRGKLCSKAEANYWGKRERNASETRDSLCYPVLCFVVLVTQTPPPSWSCEVYPGILSIKYVRVSVSVVPYGICGLRCGNLAPVCLVSYIDRTVVKTESR
jgi:hypothetical protein